MNTETWAAIDQSLVGFEDIARGSGPPVSDLEIDAVGATLGLEIDPDYREFLKRYGSASVGSYHVLGLRPNVLCPLELVEENLRYRGAGLPILHSWLIFADDGRGNPIGIASDGRVLRLDFGCDHEVDELAPSFEAFIRVDCLELE